MWLVQGSSRLGNLSARSPTEMMRLLRSPASISLEAMFSKSAESDTYNAKPTQGEIDMRLA